MPQHPDRLAIALIAAVFALSLNVQVPAASPAGPPPPPFTQCPAIGADTSCGILLYIDTDGSLKVVADPAQGPYDGEDDTLVGVQNNSSKTIDKIVLRGAQAIFGFESDGLCGLDNNGNPYAGKPAGCPYGPTGYEGPGVSFANISSDQKSGTIVFNPALAPGAKAYFALEQAISTNCPPIPTVPNLQQADAPWNLHTYGKEYRSAPAKDAATTALTASQTLELAIFPNGVHQADGKPTTYALSIAGPATLNAIRDAINALKIATTATVAQIPGKSTYRLTLSRGAENSIQLRTKSGDATSNILTHIRAKGCYLTAATDLINFWGASTPGFAPITPDALNDYLNDLPNGYLGGTDLSAPGVVAYAKSLKVPLYYLGSVNKRDDLTLDTYLCSGAPTILMVAQANVQTPERHFVVATGKNNAGTSYLINDPGMSPANPAYTGDLAPYGSTYTGLRLFNNDSTAPTSAFRVYAHSPVELLVTNPAGLQTGTDPVAGKTPQDIPASSYSVFQLADDEDPTNNPPTDPIKELEILGPDTGQYLVNVIGTGDGTYTLDFLGNDVTGAESAQSLTGTTHTGVTTQYVVNYSSVAGSTVQVVSPSISTIAPTSATQGSTSVVVTLTGSNTHFSSGSTLAFSGPGLTVASLSANTPTSLTATINVDKTASVGAYSASVTTGTEIATGIDLLTISAASASPPPAGGSGGAGGGAGGSGGGHSGGGMFDVGTLLFFGAGILLRMVTVPGSARAGIQRGRNV